MGCTGEWEWRNTLGFLHPPSSEVFQSVKHGVWLATQVVEASPTSCRMLRHCPVPHAHCHPLQLVLACSVLILLLQKLASAALRLSVSANNYSKYLSFSLCSCSRAIGGGSGLHHGSVMALIWTKALKVLNLTSPDKGDVSVSCRTMPAVCVLAAAREALLLLLEQPELAQHPAGAWFEPRSSCAWGWPGVPGCSGCSGCSAWRCTALHGTLRSIWKSDVWSWSLNWGVSALNGNAVPSELCWWLR